MKISCLLIDDEPHALEVLRSYIASTPLLEVAGECHHALDALDFLQQKEIDLIFLDIQMPRLLGTDFIKTLKNPPKIIFTTAHKEYAIDGFELDAVDYLLKPISFERFLKTVNKVFNLTQKEEQSTQSVQINSERFLYLRADRKMVKVMVNEILYIEGLKDYLKVITTSQTIITKQTISAMEEMLPEEEFMRIHRSFIISIKKIDSFNQHSIFIKKMELPIGPMYRKLFLQKISFA